MKDSTLPEPEATLAISRLLVGRGVNFVGNTPPVKGIQIIQMIQIRQRDVRFQDGLFLVVIAILI